MTNDTDPTPSTSTPEKPSPVSAPKKKSGTLAGLLLAVIILAAIAGIFLMQKNQGDSGTANSLSETDPGSVVASVNGVDITYGELTEKLDQVQGVLPPGTPQDAGRELQILEELVNLRLLVSTAESKGYAVSDSDIQDEMQGLIDTFGGEEAFEQQLAANGLTRDELYTNMKNELYIRQLVDAETAIKEVTVTDEEIQQVYDQAIASTADGADTPALADVSEMIRAQLLQQKSAGIVQDYIDTLRSEADIEILLK